MIDVKKLAFYRLRNILLGNENFKSSKVKIFYIRVYVIFYFDTKGFELLSASDLINNFLTKIQKLQIEKL